MKKRILITGASGFVGSSVVDEALCRNMDVWAGIRETSSRKHLQDPRVNFLCLDFSSVENLKNALKGLEFDYIVHAAGITSSSDSADFYRVNTEGTRNLIQAILQLKMPVTRFVFMSTLGVYGPCREDFPYHDIMEEDQQIPNTDYGKSKQAAEEYIDWIGDKLPSIVLRPTGIYGPRDKDYFVLIKTIKNHINIVYEDNKQEITFVYIKDVVQAIFLALEKGRNGRKYFLSDGLSYHINAFSTLTRYYLGNPICIPINVSEKVLRLGTRLGDIVGQVTGKPVLLNSDKYNILKQENWRCDIKPALEELGFQPQYNLVKGLKETVDWYQRNHWI